MSKKLIINIKQLCKTCFGFIFSTSIAIANIDFKPVWITSNDSTNISANLFVPSKLPENKNLPAIIFINSWSMNKYEYTMQAIRFAKAGYIVLSYSARGWGLSGGYVDNAGPNDIQDLQAIVNYLKTNTPVDANKIGAAGISYGAGIALMGLAQIPEIRTAAAMSGWADLYEAFYSNETPRAVWGGILITSGYLTGRMDPIVVKMYQNMLANKNIDELKKWASERSPIELIDKINNRDVPTSVYLSQNFEDELFQPNAVLHFFEKLEVKKHLDLNQGIHATAELSGLLGAKNYIWDNVFTWFEQELNHQEQDQNKLQLVSLVPKFSQEKHREFYDVWPSKQIALQSFYLQSIKQSDETYQIYSGGITGMSSGIPAIGPIFEAHMNLPVTTWLPGTNRLHSIYFKTAPITETLKMRGIPKVSIDIKPSYHQIQLVAYLYDVDAFGLGRLITHAPYTLHDAKANQWQTISFDLIAQAYDLPKGHALAIGFNTHDLPYAAPTLMPYSVELKHTSRSASTIEIPLLIG